jgi:hypothetical protein
MAIRVRFPLPVIDPKTEALSGVIAEGGTAGDATTLDGHPASDFQLVADKGQANGYAELDGTGKVPAAQLPSGMGGGNSYMPSGW